MSLRWTSAAWRAAQPDWIGAASAHNRKPGADKHGRQRSWRHWRRVWARRLRR